MIGFAVPCTFKTGISKIDLVVEGLVGIFVVVRGTVELVVVVDGFTSIVVVDLDDVKTDLVVAERKYFVAMETDFVVDSAPEEK